MTLSLYQIQTEYQQLADTIINNGGELPEGMEQALAINKEELQNKAVNYGFVVKQLDAECEIIDAEIKRLEWLKQSRANTVKRLKDTLSQAMQLYEILEIKTPLITVNFRKSKSVGIDEIVVMDKKYIVTKTTSAPDKVAIMAALKAGEVVPGARIIESLNIQIK